jgi:flagellar assembly factor FliW
MNIESPRFGTLPVETSKIIEFPRGLAGFEDCRRFSLFHPEGGAADAGSAPRYFILQSLDDPALAFQIADPAHFGFSYEITVDDTETALLQLTDAADAAVAVITWRDETSNQVRANLKAPLLINTRTQRGLQHVFMKLDCTLSDR